LFSEDALYVEGEAEDSAGIFWGSADGYSEDNRDLLPVNNGWATAIFDMDQDGQLDLALSGRDDDLVTGFWVHAGTGNGYGDTEAWFFSTAGWVSQITPADVNGDSHVDLILSIWGEEGSIIFWGSSTGFDDDEQTYIETGGLGWDALVEDFNGDSYPDMLFTNQKGFNGTTDFDVPSIVYWGTSAGLELSQSTLLDTYAAAGACAGDLNQDGYPDAVITSLEWLDGNNTGQKATIYWGGQAGLTDLDTSEIEATGPAGCSIYDLNLDGYQDLVIGNQSDGATTIVDSQIHWGSAAGLSLSSWTALPTRGVYTVVTHPFEDGY